MRVLALLALLACSAFAAQEPSPERVEQEARETEHHGQHEGNANELLWKIANFAILAAGIGYLLAKNVPPMFRSRTEEIQKGIKEAARMRDDAEARAADIERRMQNLGREVDEIRDSAGKEFAQEGERIAAENTQHLARVQAQAEHEIAAAAKSARQQLKAFSADLALQLAVDKIKSQMAPATQDAMLEGFVKDLEKRRAGTEVH
jgi:F-type H+-transporting ATPase subunit b